MRTHRTAAIVVNYNSAPDLARCAQSLLGSEKSPLLVVVDNASVTGGIEEAVAGYPEVEVIRSPENLGFGRGNNLGIRRALSRAGCEFVFLLNNDAMVERDTISRLEAAMDGYPEAGIIAPRIVLAEDSGVLWYGGGEIDWRKGSPRVPDYLGPADSGPALTSRNVTFASGCAMMVRRSVLEEVGGFDPRLFMYQEDLELCLRVQRSGWVIRYLPEALVMHKGQGADREGEEAFIPILSPRNPRLSFYALHVTKGRLLSMSVHARGMNALRFLAGFPAFCLYKGLQYVRHGRWDGIRSMLRGTQEALQAAREPFVNELDRSGVCAEMTDRGRGRMIFVVGNSRSGTTMMGRILGAHPSVYTFGELHFFEQLWSPADEDRRLSRAEGGRLAARLLSVQRQGYLGRANPERFQEEAGEVVASAQSEMTPAEVFGAFLRYEAAKNDKEVPCDQTPRNVFYLREILELYPEARVINMIRDPRDVLLSQKGKWKRRFLGAGSIPLREALRAWVNYHPVTISKLWNASVSAADRLDGDDRVLSLRFEDLLADPEARVREVCEFAGISFDRGLLEVPQIGSSSGHDRPGQHGIDRERAGSWRKDGLGPTEVFLCQKVTGGMMKRHGYAPAPVGPSPLWLAGSVVSLPVKLALALLFNLKRMQNIKETIKRRMA